MNLFDSKGNRKYLNAEERELFKIKSQTAANEVRTFCHTLLLTGCRISEALALTGEHIDFSGGVIVFESLKKRKKGVFRSVPVPPFLLDALNLVHDLRSKRSRKNKMRLWGWSRATASVKIAEIMEHAEISGTKASPKGLRHGFGVACVENNIPLNLVQKWLGHADMSTTAIYVDAVGEEERNIASRLWG